MKQGPSAAADIRSPSPKPKIQGRKKELKLLTVKCLKEAYGMKASSLISH